MKGVTSSSKKKKEEKRNTKEIGRNKRVFNYLYLLVPERIEWKKFTLKINLRYESYVNVNLFTKHDTIPSEFRQISKRKLRRGNASDIFIACLESGKRPKGTIRDAGLFRNATCVL